MAKKIKVNQNFIINNLVEGAGVSKANATNIINMFNQAWTDDQFGTLKVLSEGVVVKKTAARKSTARKATTKKSTAKKTTKKKSTAKKVTTGKKAVPVAAKSPKKKLKKTKATDTTNI